MKKKPVVLIQSVRDGEVWWEPFINQLQMLAYEHKLDMGCDRDFERCIDLFLTTVKYN